MTQEEKAKRYDEVFNAAKEWYNNPNSSNIGKSYLYAVFPELKENEDDRIRKGLIKAFGSIGKKEWGGVNVKNAIAWLEKQGEQKPQGKSALEAINEEKVANQFCVKPVDKTVEEYNITGIGSKHAQGKLGEMIKNLKSANETLEQKPVWSEDGKERIKNILSVLDAQVCWDGATMEKRNPYQKEID